MHYMVEKNDTCAICGISESNKNFTKEHVIQNSLFHKKYKVLAKKSLLTTRTCTECNSEYASDEELFRDFLVKLCEEYSPIAKDIFNSAYARSVARSQKKYKSEISNLDLVNLFSKQGIYLGQKTRIKISAEMWKIYNKCVEKTVRCLYFLNTGNVVPKELKLQVRYCNDPKKTLPIIHPLLNWNFDHQEIYFYGINYAPDSGAAIASIIYYDRVMFNAFIAPAEYLTNHNIT